MLLALASRSSALLALASRSSRGEAVAGLLMMSLSSIGCAVSVSSRWPRDDWSVSRVGGEPEVVAGVTKSSGC